jgi:hypothetical protein
MRGVRRGRGLFSVRELAPLPYRLPGYASSKPYEVTVLWGSCRSSLCRLYAPDDIEDLRSGERSHVGEPASPSVACVDGGADHTLVAIASIAQPVRGCPAYLEANPNNSIRSCDDKGSCIDTSAEAQPKAGHHVESLFKNCLELHTFVA